MKLHFSEKQRFDLSFYLIYRLNIFLFHKETRIKEPLEIKISKISLDFIPEEIRNGNSPFKFPIIKVGARRERTGAEKFHYPFSN